MHSTFNVLRFLILLAAFAAASVPVQADQLTAPVTGVLNDGRIFEGTLRVTSFRSSRNNLAARGLLIGTISDDFGRVTHVVSQRVTLPVQDVRGGSDQFVGRNCDFLTIETGPLNLPVINNFTIVQMDSVVVEIDAEQSGIVGNQLCGIGDRFNAGTMRPVVRDLNDIIDNMEAFDDFNQ
jgi:hypothetical protein